jgi:hypothetical protein
LQIGNEAERLTALKSGSIDSSVFNAPFGSVGKKFKNVEALGVSDQMSPDG